VHPTRFYNKIHQEKEKKKERLCMYDITYFQDEEYKEEEKELKFERYKRCDVMGWVWLG